MPKLERESGSEQEASNQRPDWIGYFYEITDGNTSPEALEELLLKEHPTMPGEREAFFRLDKKSLHRQPRVKLDDTGFHVIPIDRKI